MITIADFIAICSVIIDGIGVTIAFLSLLIAVIALVVSIERKKK